MNNSFALFPLKQKSNHQVKDGGFEQIVLDSNSHSAIDKTSNWHLYGELSSFAKIGSLKHGGSSSIRISQDPRVHQGPAAVQKSKFSAEDAHRTLVVSGYALSETLPHTGSISGASLVVAISGEDEYSYLYQEFSLKKSMEWIFATLEVPLSKRTNTIEVGVNCIKCGSVHFDDIGSYIKYNYGNINYRNIYLVVENDGVKGSYGNIEDAKSHLMEKYKRESPRPERMIVEVKKGQLGNDPHTIGCQYQSGGIAAGFNKWWQDWDSIRNMNEVASAYLEDHNGFLDGRDWPN